MSILGRCSFCDGNVISKNIAVKGKKIKVYHCENANKEYDESGQFVFTADSTCRFMVYQNAFLRWNKRSFSEFEMKMLLKEGQVTARLHGAKDKGEYFKYVILDKEYGFSILWDQEVESV